MEIEPIICTQCGAPLHGNRCEYCGTEFNTIIENNDEVSSHTYTSSIIRGGKENKIIKIYNKMDEYAKTMILNNKKED